LSHHTDGPWRRAWAVVWLVVAACGVASAVHAAPPSNGKKATLKIAATLALSGATKSYGQPALEGAQLAVEEANATGAGPAIELIAYDDGGIAAGGQEAARQITASDALVVVGPSATVVALEAGSIYADAGLACVATSAAGDTVTAHATIFQASYNTSDLGEGLAHYLRYALRGTRAAVIVKEDEWYGQGVAAGFRRAAERLEITTTYHPFITTAEAETAAQRVAADPEHPAVILATLVNDAVPAAVVTLRRQRAQGPILGATACKLAHYTAAFSRHSVTLPAYEI
jgi:branched-chain amino acid transport system substrate-binding protein